MSEGRQFVVLGVIAIITFSAFVVCICKSVESDSQNKKAKFDKCKEPVFFQAVGHSYTTGWVYGCADGSMIELPQPLPSAPIGNPDGWAGGR